MTDLVFIKDGKEYSAREAYLHAIAHGHAHIDMAQANAHEALERLGYVATEKKKSMLRRFRAWFKATIRGRLIAIGKLERHFA